MQRDESKLTFVQTGESAVAEMLDEEAPAICEMIWNRLPIEHDLLHGMYSGAEVFAMLENPASSPPRTWCNCPYPASYSTSRTKAGAEWARANRWAKCASSTGAGWCCGRTKVCLPASLFARIPGDWKYDWTAFAQACRKVRWEGPRKLRIAAA